MSSVIALMLFFLDTKLGQAYIAKGDNPDMARSFGIQLDLWSSDGLGLIKWCDQLLQALSLPSEAAHEKTT